jgi:hypothetical protein
VCGNNLFCHELLHCFVCFCHLEFIFHNICHKESNVTWLSRHGVVTSWIHELKWYSGCHACVLMNGLVTLQSLFALLCFDLYRPVIDADLDNRHHLQLRLWMFELALFTDIVFFFLEAGLIPWNELNKQKMLLAGCLCRAEGEEPRHLLITVLGGCKTLVCWGGAYLCIASSLLMSFATFSCPFTDLIVQDDIFSLTKKGFRYNVCSACESDDLTLCEQLS